MNKLLVICGPTATGKTRLGIRLSKKFGGEIVSADSRQIFQGMDIGTGKDIPKTSKIIYPWFSKYGYYLIDGVKVWGYDLVDPKKDFSVSGYLKFATKIISDIQKKGKLPVMVGGTGLYIKGVVSGIPTAGVPRNKNLRQSLSKKNTEELFETLASLSPMKAGSLNSSDKKNPRRLIRAIEVAQYYLTSGKRENPPHASYNVLSLGLTCPKPTLESSIEKRVNKRVQDGIKDEIKNLLKKGVDWHNQSMFSLGYRQWRDYFEGGAEEERVIDEWIKEEKKYAKRQVTWFKKIPGINWFDITSKEYPVNVEKMVKKWHNSK